MQTARTSRLLLPLLFLLLPLAISCGGGRKGGVAEGSAHKPAREAAAIESAAANDTVRYVPYRKGNKWFHVDRHKKGPHGPGHPRAFPGLPDFDYIWPFTGDGYCRVKKDGRYGMVDTTGRLIVDPIYTDMGDHYSSYVAMEAADGENLIFSKTGRLAYRTRLEIHNIGRRFLVLKKGGEEFCLIDLRTGRTIVPFGRYCYFGPPRDEGSDLIAVARTYTQGFKKRHYWQELDRFGYIDTTGALVVPLVYEYTDMMFEGMGGVEKGGKKGFINAHTRELAIPCAYENVDQFKNGYVRVECPDGHKVLDKGGRTVAAAPYICFVYSVENDIIPVAQDRGGPYAIMDRKGRLTTPYEYQDANSFFLWRPLGKYLPAKKGGKWGVVDRHGKLVVPFLYENKDPRFAGVEIFENNRFCVTQGEKEGVVDYRNRILLPVEFGYIDDSHGVYRTDRGYIDYGLGRYFED